MLLARQLAERVGKLLDAGFDPFGPDAVATITAHPEISHLLGRELPAEAALLTARSILLDRKSRPPANPTEFAATVPPYARSSFRTTVSLVRELISTSRQEIIAAGYEVKEASVIEELIGACRRHVALTIVCDRNRRSAHGIMELWPNDVVRPDVYINRVDDRLSDKASMHSKFLLVDGVRLLVTSANFTYLAHNENVEFGVHIRGHAAQTAREFVRMLIRNGILERFNR